MFNHNHKKSSLIPELQEVLDQSYSSGMQTGISSGNPSRLQKFNASNELEFESLLRKSGITTNRIVDKRTPEILQTLLRQKNVLTPFFGNKVSQVSIPKNFIYYPWDETFTEKYKKLNNVVVPFGSAEEKKLLQIRGFYDPKTGTIHLRPRSNFGIALLLAIQKLSAPGFKGFFGPSVYQAVSYYFANLLLSEQGLEPLKIEDTNIQLHCAELLVGVAGRQMVGKAYFQNHSDLVKYLQSKTPLGRVSITDLTGDMLCKSRFLRTARFAAHQANNMVGVGRTGARSVRLWLRSANVGKHEIQISGGSGGTRIIRTIIPTGNSTDNTVVVNYPNSNQQPALQPLTKYNYKVFRLNDRTLVGQGTFETSPAGDKDTPQKVVFALMSCHQPFTDTGTIDPRSNKMLKILPRVLQENNVKFIISCGDQIYSDNPGVFSVFNNSYLVRQSVPQKTDIMHCSADEVRKIFDMRYRTCWSMPSIGDMYANYPAYTMMDDHDIKNSWGTLKEHSEPKFANIYKGSLQAYYDYQASRVLPKMPALPASFHYQFSYGNIGVFVMDLRSGRFFISERQTRMFGTKQLDDLRQFLSINTQKKVLFIVTSVPVFFVPEWMSNLGSKVVNETFEDHWSHPNNISDRDAFLKLIYAHRQANPNQIVSILSGDVHIGNACQINMPGSAKPSLYQFTSSPLTVNETSFTKWKVKQAPILDTGINKSFDFPCGSSAKRCSGTVRHLPGIPAASKNPFVDMNIGLIEVQRTGDVSKIKFKLIGSHPTTDRPVTYFETHWLG